MNVRISFNVGLTAIRYQLRAIWILIEDIFARVFHIIPGDIAISETLTRFRLCFKKLYLAETHISAELLTISFHVIKVSMSCVAIVHIVSSASWIWVNAERAIRVISSSIASAQTLYILYFRTIWFWFYQCFHRRSHFCCNYLGMEYRPWHYNYRLSTILNNLKKKKH